MAISDWIGNTWANLASILGVARASIANVCGNDAPSSGPDIIFDEQWSGCSGQQTSGPTGEDEANWTLSDCSGSNRLFDFDASYGALLINRDRVFGPYLRNSDCGGDSTHLYGQIAIRVPSAGNNNHFAYRWLWFKGGTRGIHEPSFSDYDADEFQIWDYNWGGSAKRLPKDTDHVITIIADNVTHTFDVDINGTVEYNNVAMQGTTGDYSFGEWRLYALDEGRMYVTRIIVADGKVI